MNIRDKLFNSKKTFIIAEIGNNHNGCVNKALTLVDQAIEFGADCVKFQMRDMNEVYREKSLKRSGEDLGTEYVLDLLAKYQLTINEHQLVKEYCDKKKIIYMCTPWDKKSVDILESFNVGAYKVASADLTNLPLIKRLAETKKPLILSTGMSTLEEIQITVNYLNNICNDFILLHCNSTYPAPLHDINLNFLDSLKLIHPHIGYSGHERGILVSLAAIAKGAMVLERHLTLDRNMEGPDHAASLEFNEFKELIGGVRQIEEALGNSGERILSQGEMINRENLSKSIVASKDLKKGHVISIDDIKIMSPGQGLSPQYLEELLGKKLTHDMEKEDYFFLSDLNNISYNPEEYSFRRPWGIPVRYHDFEQYSMQVKPDIFEFHLSYNDLNLEISKYIKHQNYSGFVVHAPELFENSLLMDLASPDINYRKKSIEETQRVINITRELNYFFPNTMTPLIVANIGGFSMDEPIPKSNIDQYYLRFKDSLEKLDTKNVEIIPQTMAPFPWHFGGQRYQNMFVEAEEIVEWCKKLSLRICFDVSHSKLTCNFLDYDFYDFSEKVSKYTAHIHLGDAKDLNGEGLQIGKGDIDFDKLSKVLDRNCPTASFIPEIWQGHKNNGEGFWVALKRLNSIF